MEKRCFLAINTSDELKKAVAGLMEELALENKGSIMNLVDPQNLHLTLNFLGNLNDQQIADISVISRDLANHYHQTKLVVERLTVWPDINSPKTVVIEIGDNPSIISLRNRLGQKIEQLGISLDKKAFRPHLTLARIKSASPDFLLPELNDRLEFSVNSFELMQSTLQSTGSVYQIIESFNFIK